MNLQEQVSRIQDMMEQMSGKYNKPTSEIERLVYNLLNRYTEGSEVYRIEHFVSRHDLEWCKGCLLYTSPSPRDRQKSRMPSSA